MQVAIKVELEQVGRMIGRAACFGGLSVLKA
jgi:hypothetical protein